MRNCRVVAVTLFCLVSGCIPALAQKTIHVPADQPTIQAGIDSALDGDTVLVASGTYNERIDFKGKNITVSSESGPQSTIIDGQSGGAVVAFRNHEGNAATLSGFTIQNGSGYLTAPNFVVGGGIVISGASPTIKGNWIINNKGTEGAGVYVAGSTNTVIQNNRISNNVERGGSGGGGGGIEVTGGATVDGNEISDNTTLGYGGGIFVRVATQSSVQPGAMLIRNNRILNNVGNGGGGVALLNTACTFPCTIPVTLIQNLIGGNKGGFAGGGVFGWDGATSMIQNTIANNDGSAVYATSGGHPTMINNIVASTTNAPSGFCGEIGQNNLIYLPPSNPYVLPCQSQMNGGTFGAKGNIFGDPLLIAPDARNYRAQAGSPVINAGLSGNANVPSTDLDGQPRTAGGKIDIGAFEFAPTTFTVAPASLGFADQPANTQSAAQAVTISNTGNAALQIGSLTLPNAFVQTNTCQTTNGIAVSGSCTISVSFAPTARGTFGGTMTIASNSATSPNSVALSGKGIAPVVSVSPASLGFPDQTVGGASAPLMLTIQNTGDASLTIPSVAVTGDFAQTNNCASVAANASCSVTVTFSPVARGTRSGTLTINSNALSSPDSVPLSGRGIGPDITLTPSSLTFAGQAVGTTSAAQSITLASSGEQALAISNIAASGDFAQTNNCPATLGPSATCTINVTVTPSAKGLLSGTLSITDNAPGSPQSGKLSGVGTTAVASLSATTLDFGQQLLGRTSPARSLTLRNVGDAAMTITGVVATGDYAQTNLCPQSLPPNASCTITITFTPTDFGARPGNLTITTSATNSPSTVSLTGTGVPLQLLPILISFGGQLVGTSSAAQTVVLTNAGSTTATLQNIAITGDFTQTNNCAGTLAAGASCTFTVTFTPSAPGFRSGALTVTDDQTGSPRVTSLGGTGTVPIVALSPGSLTFGSQVSGTTSPAQTILVRNTGTGPLNVSNITASGDFAQTNNCNSPVAANGSCSIQVTFTPTAGGTRTGTISITQNSALPTVTAPLTGTGLSAFPAPTLSSLSPAGYAVNTSGTKTLTVTGANFFPQSTVFWNGNARTTTYVSSTQLQAQVTDADVSRLGEALVTVQNPQPGGGASAAKRVEVYLALPLSSRGMVYDPTRKRLYVSVPASAPANGSTIMSIDPETGNTLMLVALTGDPGRLALTDDSQFLYVGYLNRNSVERVNLITGVVDETIQLGQGILGAFMTTDVLAVPGSPHSVVVLRGYANTSPAYAGIAVYDDTKIRPNVAPEFANRGANISYLAFGSGATQLFGTGDYLYRYSLDSSGLTLLESKSGLNGGRLWSDGASLYETNPARRIDIATESLAGTFSFATGTAAIAPDPSAGRVYLLDGFTNQLYAADPVTFNAIDSLQLPLTPLSSGTDLVRWGSQGLAFRFATGGVNGFTDRIVILKTSLTGVSTTTPASGWWWDPKLSGTGFFVEYGGKSGSGMFVGGFLYDAAGNDTWLVSTGPMSGSTYTSTWLKTSGGQTLTGPYKAPSNTSAGNLTMAFSDSTHAVMTRPDGSQVNLQRFSFSSGSTISPPVAGAPQSGWWWAGSSLSGTGYGIEIQGNAVFIVAYVYDSSGNPVWYLATGALTSPTSYSGTWQLYAGGPQLTSPEGTYSAHPVSGSDVAMSLTFSDATHGTLTMGSVSIPIVRFQEF